MHLAWILFSSHRRWMAWNLMLAFVPLLLGLILFRQCMARTALWWIGVVAFVAFLPNAPYVMSDLVHLPADARAAPSITVVVFGLLPLYGVIIAAGLEAYVLSLLSLRRYLRSIGMSRVLPIVNLIAALCTAVGVFFGRVDRLNSWDPLLHPERLWQAAITLPAHARGILLAASVILIAGELVAFIDHVSLVGLRGLSTRARPR
jgi:uncharacterized membrane protein